MDHPAYGLKCNLHMSVHISVLICHGICKLCLVVLITVKTITEFQYTINNVAVMFGTNRLFHSAGPIACLISFILHYVMGSICKTRMTPTVRSCQRVVGTWTTKLFPAYDLSKERLLVGTAYSTLISLKE